MIPSSEVTSFHEKSTVTPFIGFGECIICPGVLPYLYTYNTEAKEMYLSSVDPEGFMSSF